MRRCNNKGGSIYRQTKLCLPELGHLSKPGCRLLYQGQERLVDLLLQLFVGCAVFDQCSKRYLSRTFSIMAWG